MSSNVDMSLNVDINKIWDDLYNQVSFNRNPKVTASNIENTNIILNCTNCNSINIATVCYDCGLVLNNDRILDTSITEYQSDKIESRSVSFKTNSSLKGINKLIKIQEWNMWTKEEKNNYKLKIYIKELCSKLKIIESLFDSIIDTVIIVMDIIKKNEGTKRAKVKDGIIIICIYYVSKNTCTPYFYTDLAKLIDLNIKYITKSEKIILELINSGKLKLDKMTMLKTHNPYEYVMNIINKNNIKISNHILIKVKILIEICEDNDLLLDHTPLAIGVCCFYYIIKMQNDINVDIKMFSELYNLSIVTVIKTYNKLKIYDDKIQKLLNC